MPSPVIFLAFANNEREPFLDLTKEDDGIYDLFAEDNTWHEFKIHRDQHTSASELVKYIQKFKNQISVFHFGGHASNSELFLSDQTAREEGLASLLGKQKHLSCVFLNGCYTKDLVDRLLDQNVPVVIATDRAVNDNTATDLSLNFYKHLADGETIKNAFEAARDAVLTTNQKDIDFRDRGAGPKAAQAPNTEDQFPWGLYFKDEKAMNWKLNQALADILNISKFFILRLIAAILLVFVLWAWAYRHVGTASTSFIIAGPLALVAIATFFTKSVNKISPVISNLTTRFLAFFLKTPVLILAWIIVFFVALFGTSVVVKHDNLEDLNMTLSDQDMQPLWQSAIETGDEETSRLFVVTTPFKGALKLDIDGFQQYDMRLRPFLGNRLTTDSLLVKAALLLRLAIKDFRLAPRIKIRIDLPSGDTIKVDPVQNPSVLIGPERAIPEAQTAQWVEDIVNMGNITKEQAEKIAYTWANPRSVSDTLNFQKNQIIKISKIIRDSILYEKDYTIINKTINDVLLE